MNTINPTISIVIPTHNRSDLLKRTLNALCVQTFPLEQVEVLVIADGCHDDTSKMLHAYKAPFTLQVIEQPGLGAAAARNKGAARARAKHVLFLDDDVEATSRLIEAHVQAHQNKLQQVVIGPYPPARSSRNDFFSIQLRGWWEGKFHSLRQPGHRWTYQDLLSGNFSIAVDLFTRVGGFDTNPAFKAHEDYELGMRLIQAGANFTLATAAVAYHHDASNLDRSYARKRQEGIADVLLAQRYPELLATLPLVQAQASNSYLDHFLQALAFLQPRAADRLALLLRRTLDSLESLHLRQGWKHLNGILVHYWYWRGVAEATGSQQALRQLIQDYSALHKQPGQTLELDLSRGLDEAECQLDEKRPFAARIRFGRQIVGIIPEQPGAEALHGAHLRPILATALAVPLLEAMVLEGIIAPSETSNRQKLRWSILRQSAWFGLHEPGQMWFEQYEQWQRLERQEPEADFALYEYWSRLRTLELETAWLEEECDYWQRRAVERLRRPEERQERVAHGVQQL